MYPTGFALTPTHEDWFRFPRLPEEPRRLRGDARARASRPGTRLTPTPRTPTCSSSTPAPSSTRAKQESIDAILEMAQHKKTRRCQRLVVTGLPRRALPRRAARARFPRSTRCSAPARCRRSSQAIDGSIRRSGSGAARTSHRRPHRRTRSTPARPDPLRPTSTTPTRRARSTTPRHFAYVKIAEGCDYKCAFCIIPTLRGALPQPAGRVDRRGGAGARGAAASASCCSSRRTRPSTASTAASAARWRGCSAS